MSTATHTSLGHNASDSEEDNNITDFHTSKHMLKGRQFFNSGYVKNIKHQQKGSYQFFNCHVMASYSIQTIYNVTLTLQSQTGKVMDASYNCCCSAFCLGRLCNSLQTNGGFYQPDLHVECGEKNKRDPKKCSCGDCCSSNIACDTSNRVVVETGAALGVGALRFREYLSI